MNRYTLTALALLIGLTSASFSDRKKIRVYFTYNSIGAHNDIINYLHADWVCPGIMNGNRDLAWFSGMVYDPDEITAEEFNECFEEIDGNCGGLNNDILTDEFEDHILLEKRN